MDNHKKGKQLEEFVAQRLKEILKDPSIRATKASGGGERNTEIGDINCSKYFIECKNWEKKHISFSMDVWNKLCSEIPFNSTKSAWYIIQHPSGKKFIMGELEDWFRLLEENNEEKD